MRRSSRLLNIRTTSISVTFFLISSIGWLSLSLSNLWKFFGVGVMNPSFADLRLISSASSCEIDSQMILEENSCDPWQRPFNYSRLWIMLFRFLHLGQSHTNLVGNLQIVLFALSLSIWLHTILNYSRKTSIYPLILVNLLFIAFSPPVLLLIERGNSDILIFALLTLIYFLFKSNWHFLASFVLGFAIALKIFPLALILFFATRSIPRKWRLSYCVLGSLGFLASYQDLVTIGQRSRLGWNTVMFGINSIPSFFFQFFHLPANQILEWFLGVFLLCALVALLYFWRLPFIFHSWASRDFDFREILEFWSYIFVLIFVFLPSYDLRLPMAIPLFFALLIRLESKFHRYTFSVFLWTLLYASYFSPASLIIIIGDFLIYLFVATLLCFLHSNRSRSAL